MLKILIRVLSILTFLFWVAGCADAATQNESFNSFFTQYSTNKTFALSRSVFPLRSFKYKYGVDQQGKEETALIETKELAETLAKQPTLSEYAAKNGLSVARQPAQDTSLKRIVNVYKQGTDWLIEYHFVKTDSRWYMHEIRDYSL